MHLSNTFIFVPRPPGHVCFSSSATRFIHARRKKIYMSIVTEKKANHSLITFVQYSYLEGFLKMFDSIWGWSYFSQCASIKWLKAEKFHFRFCKLEVQFASHCCVAIARNVNHYMNSGFIKVSLVRSFEISGVCSYWLNIRITLTCALKYR